MDKQPLLRMPSWQLAELMTLQIPQVMGQRSMFLWHTSWLDLSIEHRPGSSWSLQFGLNLEYREPEPVVVGGWEGWGVEVLGAVLLAGCGLPLGTIESTHDWLVQQPTVHGLLVRQVLECSRLFVQ